MNCFWQDWVARFQKLSFTTLTISRKSWKWWVHYNLKIIGLPWKQTFHLYIDILKFNYYIHFSHLNKFSSWTNWIKESCWSIRLIFKPTCNFCSHINLVSSEPKSEVQNNSIILPFLSLSMNSYFIQRYFVSK